MFVFVIFQSQIAKIEMISLKKKKKTNSYKFFIFLFNFEWKPFKGNYCKIF